MVPFTDWFPLSMVGAAFTTLGLLKVYGFTRGIVGGAGKSTTCRLLGSCPTWSRQINWGVAALFLLIGLSCFAILASELLHSGQL
jgi:hypothetical protein